MNKNSIEYWEDYCSRILSDDYHNFQCLQCGALWQSGSGQGIHTVEDFGIMCPECGGELALRSEILLKEIDKLKKDNEVLREEIIRLSGIIIMQTNRFDNLQIQYPSEWFDW